MASGSGRARKKLTRKQHITRRTSVFISRSIGR
jgi:hypothetical protein